MYYLPVIINDNGLKTYMKTKDEKIFRLRPKRAELNMKIKEMVSLDNPDFDEIDRLYEKSITMLGFSAEKYDALHQLLKKYKETHEGIYSLSIIQSDEKISTNSSLEIPSCVSLYFFSS